MIDRKKVIEGLTELKKYLPSTMWESINDAIALLKEQEAVEPRVSSAEQRCGNCNKIIEMDGWKACPWCGKPIDWESWWRNDGVHNHL